ncbi:MAG: class E sortase [Thermoleophilia bacterium]
MEPSVSRRRARLRRLGTFLLVLGLLVSAYAVTVVLWRDPVTDVYARWQQHRLADELEREEAALLAAAPLDGAPAAIAVPVEPAAATSTASAPLDPGPTPSSTASPRPLAGPPLSVLPGPAEIAAAPAPAEATPEERAAALEARLRADAERVTARLGQGRALGRLVIPRLGLRTIVVNGTRWAEDLSRGPGKYEQTVLPGLGGLTAIAGHRTTFGAPFRHIDDLEAGDPISLELPYGTFRYRVVGHRIVDKADWSIIRPRGYEALVLSACHPLYSAAQRWIVVARLASVELRSGAVWRPAGEPTAAT